MPTKQILVHSISMALLVPAVAAFAQTDRGVGVAQEDGPWIGVVTAKSAEIRCGANESYYAIATASEGDFVRVHGKRQGCGIS